MAIRIAGSLSYCHVATAPSLPRPVAPPDVYGPSGRSAWLDIDWREHQKWVTIGGRRVNVIEMGPAFSDENPVVFIHGLSGCWQNFLENIPEVARGRRVVALDLPGFGHSEMPAEKISMPGYARTVEALLDELEIEAACLVGNSMGGFIGAEVAIQFPARVERLVLISAAGITFWPPRSETVLAGMRRAENRVAMYAGWLASKSDTLARRARMRRVLMSVAVAHADRLPAPLIAEQVRGAGKPGFVDALDGMTDYPLPDRLGEIACPTLIFWGTKDHLVTVRDAYEFERLIPDSRALVWEDTGHMAMLERPTAFHAELEPFLAE